ncbi:MAG: ribosome maturation factor RimM [Bacteroidales bacterium]
MLASANKLLPIAKVIKSFGIKGEILIRYAPLFQEVINEKKPVFITYDGLPVPFFIESITPKGANQATLKLRGIDSIELAEEITGQEVMTEYSSLEPEEPSPMDYVGFKVKDSNGVHVGTVTNFYDYPGNPCFGITRVNKTIEELLLPVHEDIILGTDSVTKTLFVNIPNGLLNL